MSDTSGLDNFWGTSSVGDGQEAGRSTATLTSLLTSVHDGKRFVQDDAPISSTRSIAITRFSDISRNNCNFSNFSFDVELVATIHQESAHYRPVCTKHVPTLLLGSVVLFQAMF